MALAGETAIAGKIPGERIATTVNTSGSSAFSSETVVMSVAAALVSGRTYRVRWHGHWNGTVDESIIVRIREDNLTGNVLQFSFGDIARTGDWNSDPSMLEAEFTATSTASKTFVVTGERQSGSNNMELDATSGRPAYLYVDYIRG